MGVFLSRSSVNIIAIRHVWIFAILQLLNFAFFFCEAVFQFLPSFWLMIFLVLFEGLLGGATYVNAFYHIAKEVGWAGNVCVRCSAVDACNDVVLRCYLLKFLKGQG
jgi:hypothetical protein